MGSGKSSRHSFRDEYGSGSGSGSGAGNARTVVAIPRCTKGHRLVRMPVGFATSGYGSHSCDCCSRNNITARDVEPIWRCSICDYDKCEWCVEEGTAGADSPSPMIRSILVLYLSPTNKLL